MVDKIDAVELGPPRKKKKEVDIREPAFLIFNRKDASYVFSKDTVIPYFIEKLLDFKIEDSGN